MEIYPVSSDEKADLSDWPGHVLYPIILKGCNLKCKDCFVPHLVFPQKHPSENISEQELLDILSRLDKDFYDGVLITGGEPTIHKDLPNLLKKIKHLSLKVRLFTNGTNPDMLQQLIDENLVDSIAMDIKSTRQDYEKRIATPINIDDIEKSMKLTSRTKDHEFRTVINKRFHTLESIRQIRRWIQDTINQKPNFIIRNFQSGLEYVSKEPGEPFSQQEFEDIEREVNKLKEVDA